DVVNGDDVRVIECGGGARFANQTLAGFGSLAGGGKNFDRDFALQFEIRCAIDRAHAAAAEFAVEPVTVAQDRAWRETGMTKFVRENLGLLRVRHEGSFSKVRRCR